MGLQREEGKALTIGSGRVPLALLPADEHGQRRVGDMEALQGDRARRERVNSLFPGNTSWQNSCQARELERQPARGTGQLRTAGVQCSQWTPSRSSNSLYPVISSPLLHAALSTAYTKTPTGVPVTGSIIGLPLSLPLTREAQQCGRGHRSPSQGSGTCSRREDTTSFDRWRRPAQTISESRRSRQMVWRR